MNDVLICLFASAGFDKSARGLAGAGRRLADELGANLRAVVIGSEADALAHEVARVADAVTVADQAELAEYQPETSLGALALLCKELQPRAVLLANDTYSQELAPRLAHRLGGSAVGDAVEVRAGVEGLRVVRQVYGGKAQAVIELKRVPAVVWLRARSFAPAEPRADEAGTITRAALDVQPLARTRIVERVREGGGEARLEEARVIVSGGRGIGGPEPFAAELKPLADLLGAQLAASRAACDAGWVPPTWQIGQTGKKVTPELYLAIAITGASQHIAGISEAKTIAAINTDPDAPIFKHSRFGIVADYRQVVPLLREKLAALQK
ncbi:MAG TPA: electron transfer flavoprotein subunit alpha/FixB family protein [Pyrinomonadaceae bacterium]|jgi:electron transfer flavoprotein alpha subunit|nr:electron transfer flavoprotein subunit alpha/FixB family protein [Pyrinomonadaceae bacterium]